MYHRLFNAGLLWLFIALSGPAFSAGIVAQTTAITRTQGGITLSLGLTEAAPFKVFTLNSPQRLLVDLGDIDLSAMPAGLAENISEVTDVRFGLFQIGESRVVLDLAVPMVVQSAQAMRGSDGTAKIVIKLAIATEASFARRSAPLAESLWQPQLHDAQVQGARGLPLIALDPGHGGIDQGAVRDEFQEKDIVLAMAQTLRDVLLKDGAFRVMLTRDSDVYVPLGERVELARRAGAVAFISLHADVVTKGTARGTTVFSLSEAGADQEAVTIATLENRADLVAGISVEGEDDQITQVLLQMAHRVNDALSNRFADIVAEALWFPNGTEIKSRRMAAGFRVLRAPEIPSILVEIGFMSDETDLEKLNDPEWRLSMAETLRDAIGTWRGTEARMRGILRN